MFDAGKTRMIGLPYGKKNYDDMLSRFHPIPGRYGRTDGQTDFERLSKFSTTKNVAQTDGQNCYINIARQCTVLTRDKNHGQQFRYRFSRGCYVMSRKRAQLIQV